MKQIMSSERLPERGVNLTRRVALRLVGVSLVLSVALRLPQLHGDIHTDEAEYAHYARMWARGGRLYHDVFIDRPQLLLLLYRGLNRFGVFAPVPLRVFMMVWGAALVAVVAWIVRVIGGSWRAVAAASFLFAWFSASKLFDGQFVNGELLAALPAALCIAFGVTAARRGPSRSLFAVAGALGGIAVLFKQSGIDGVAALCLWLAFRRRDNPTFWGRAREIAAVAAGFMVPIGIAAVHGATVGFDGWVRAMVGSRIGQAGASGTAGMIQRLSTSAVEWGPYLGALVLGVAIAPRLVRRHPNIGVVWCWLAMSLAAFVAGGGYSRHYYQALFPSVCALSGLALDALLARRKSSFAVAYSALAVLPILIWGPPILDGQKTLMYRDAERIAMDVRQELPKNQPLARLFTNGLVPALSDRPPYDLALTTIWQEVVPSRISSVVHTLESQGAPRVVLAQSVDEWPPIAAPVKAALLAHYRRTHRVGPYGVYNAIGSPPKTIVDSTK